MYPITLFLSFIPLLALILLGLNLVFAPHTPYQEKSSTFECGFHSFLGQNRTQFTISFFIFGILFLLFDLELVHIFPFSISFYNNDVYGFSILLIFFAILTIGFGFELGKKALTIDSKQNYILFYTYTIFIIKKIISKLKMFRQILIMNLGIKIHIKKKIIS